MRRQPTQEQRDEAAAKRAKVGAMAKTIAGMTDVQRAEWAGSRTLCTIDGHPLSLRNTILAIMQVPTVSVVGGFRQWIAAGRCVRKGEHGILISAPRLVKGEGDIDDVAGFLVVTVFDIGQTDAIETEAEVAA
jgi:hypothetical protein